MDTRAMRGMNRDMREVKGGHIFHPYRKYSNEQKALARGAVVADHIGRIAKQLSENRYPFNTELRRFQQNYDQLEAWEGHSLTQQLNGVPVPVHQLQAVRDAKKIFFDRITKLEKIRETMLDRDIKMLKSEYDKAFAFRTAKKLEKEKFWHDLAVAGLAWANHAGQNKLNYLGDLIKGLIKAVLEDKI